MCNPDGSYEKIQIDENKGYAYCADDKGQEIDGTPRNFSSGPPDCPGNIEEHNTQLFANFLYN